MLEPSTRGQPLPGQGPGRPCGASVRAAGLLGPLAQLLPSPPGVSRGRRGEGTPLAPARPGATAAAGLLSGAAAPPGTSGCDHGRRASVPMGPLWPRSRTGLAGPHSAQDQAEVLPRPRLASQGPRAPASCRPHRLTETRAVARQERDERAHDQDFASLDVEPPSTWAERPEACLATAQQAVRGTRGDGIQAALTDPCPCRRPERLGRAPEREAVPQRLRAVEGLEAGRAVLAEPVGEGEHREGVGRPLLGPGALSLEACGLRGPPRRLHPMALTLSIPGRGPL